MILQKLCAYSEAVSLLERENLAALKKNQEHIDSYFDAGGKIHLKYALYRNCNVCGSNSTRPFLLPTPYDLVECTSCGFRYMNPIIDPQKTTILTQGISRLRSEVIKDPQWVTRHERMTQQVREILRLRDKGAFLDVGCGLGRHLRLAKKHFERAEGIELCKVSLEYCRAAGLQVYGDPLETLNLTAASYDVVLMNQVIEHLSDPRTTCQEVWRVLKPSGIFYLDTPNFASLAMRLFREHNRIISGSSHISLFSVETLSRLLRSLGFEIVSTVTYQTDIFPVDLAVFLFDRKNFRHRRNLQIPFYLLFYRVFHEIFEERVFRNLGDWGSYMRVIVRKP
ncbi:MAG: methyltransferase domain-containing protein [Deltaproteobacteria bacterium]|nr:methyltransferase domain-containing protein [Deltaproteobacteria bacterium]